MTKYKKIMLLISAIGALACLISFIIAISRAKYINAVVFGATGLYCLSAAITIYKKNR